MGSTLPPYGGKYKNNDCRKLRKKLLFLRMEKLEFLAWQNLHTHLVWIYQGIPQTPKGEAQRAFFTAWYLLRGSLRMVVNHIEVEAVANDWVLLPIGKDWRQFTPCARILSLNFAATWVTGLPLFTFDEPLVFKPHETRGWLAAAKPMLNMVRRRFPSVYTTLPRQSVEFDVYALLQYHLQTWLRRIWPRLEARGAKTHLLMPKDERAILIKKHVSAIPLHEPFRLEMLTRSFGLSVSQINRVFYAEFSITPKHYFEQRRLNVALSALQNSVKPIKEISYQLGFKHSSGFSAWCRKQTGRNPKALRKVGLPQGKN